MDLKKGEKKRLLLILTVTPEFLKSKDSKETSDIIPFSDSDEETEQESNISILSEECFLSFHCFTALPCQDSSDFSIPIHDREIVVTNLSPFPSAFSVETVQNSSYVCSVFTENETELQ